MPTPIRSFRPSSDIHIFNFLRSQALIYELQLIPANVTHSNCDHNTRRAPARSELGIPKGVVDCSERMKSYVGAITNRYAALSFVFCLR